MIKKLSTALILILALAAFIPGCAEPVSAQEIANRSVAATPEVNTVKMDMSISMDAELTGSAEAFSMSLAGDVSGAVNAAAKEMQMTMTMGLDMAPLGKMDLSTDMYVVGQWIYTRTSMLGLGETWSKTPLTDEAWRSQDQLEQQAEFLRGATEITRMGTETVDGVECYVLEIKPDFDALMEWIMSQYGGAGMGMDDFDPGLFDLADMIKTFNMKEWIARDTYLPVKVEMDIVFEMSEKDFDATATGNEKIVMNIKSDIKYYDYNKPVTIELPPEALTAQEMPGLT